MGNPAGLCGTCRWYGAERADTGSCRLNAPVIFGTSGAPQQTNQLAWPEVRVDDWCSEFSDQASSWTPPSGGPGSVAGVSSFNTRTGAVTLTTADITTAGGAPIASPTFTGTPTLPTGTIGVTQTAGNNSTALATTAFVATTVGAYLPLAGGTLTGPLTITPASGSASVTMNKPAAATGGNNLIGSVAGSTRWALQLGNAAAETGSNVGSDLQLLRYTDAGVAIDTPLTITRSSGLVTLSQNLLVSAGNLNINTASSVNLVMNKAASGQSVAVFGRTNGANRWIMMLGESTAEGGSNAGSNFIIQSWNDAGSAALANTISIVRSTGVCTFSAAIVNGPSDRTLKENIAPLDGALDKVKALQGVSFNMKATPEKREIGLVAQDVEPVLPEVIQIFDPGTVDGEQRDPKLPPLLALDYPKLVAVLIEAVKTLTARVEKLEARR